MHDDIHFYEPTNGHGLPHDPFNALVAPRPIGWISTQNRDGVLNLAPYSFFNAFNYRPPIVGFASIGYKDSVRNAEETGEFCWNLVTRSLSEAMNETSATVTPEVDEFALAGLTPADSRVIAVPRVAESPVSLECRLSQVVQLADSNQKKVDTWVVFGEVVGVHIARELLRDGIFDTGAAEPVMRAGGPGDYFSVGPDQKFQMRRPKP
ncbi:flavin reductase family protein [Marinobacter sp. X15-166B]|uniref:flavin reductase family protein n=1 Tax=Marinobacter sp. X15-166B TaxID=1897620 RepID=UPI00085CC6CE|nr:flavin reductase family protein [Marinobacter sp. X15-166B]OEY67532.1 Asp/Glu/hydantoin racemase [Marinobacter sp. X15-166B]